MFIAKLSKAYFLLTLVGAILVQGCNSDKKPNDNFSSIPDYDLSRPTTIHLNGQLDEISGLAFYAPDSSVFAVSDEAGYLYKIFLRSKIAVQKWQISKKADFEDLVLVDSTFFVLKSNGDITACTFTVKDSILQKEYEFKLSGQNEFESLYYDSTGKNLVLLCKDCEGDKKKSLSAYAMGVGSGDFSSDPFFVVDVNDVADKLQLDKMKFKPSATAIHPLTGELYILSSVNKALIIAGKDGKVKEAYPLDPNLFKQPEGITFAPWGDLLISNEAGEYGAPNILIFKHKSNNVR